MREKTLARGALAFLVIGVALLAAGGRFARGRRGVTLTLTQGLHLQGRVLLRQTVPGVDLDWLQRRPDLPRRFFSARWSAYWYSPKGGLVDLRLRADDPVVLRLDDRVVLERTQQTRVSRVVTSVALSPGLHALELDYEALGRVPAVRLAWAFPGGTPRPIDLLFPERSDFSALEFFCEGIGRLLLVLSGVSFSLLLLSALLLRLVYHRGLLASWGLVSIAPPARVLSVALPLGIVLYAAALRFEALVVRYWSPGAPDWAILVASFLKGMHPGWPPWEPEAEPYRGDPFSYLRYAREMTHVYDAHVREPLFVLTTKVFLFLFSGRPIAVNFASASFSVGVVFATYLLGARAFSRSVGLLAALAFAVERQVISLSVEGWRDDAFTFFVVLASYTLLGLDRRPSFGRALLAGLIGAAACLTRITSLSFLLPAYALIAVTRPRRPERLLLVALSLFILAVVVAPYLISCAIVFHDAFYAINAHTVYYRSDAAPSAGAMSWWTFVLKTARPAHLLDNALVGVSSYPFNQKWAGFESWARDLGEVLYFSSLAGLVLFLFSRRGRLLLVILLSSLVPFAFTFEFAGGGEWRFRMHAYPFYLLAASLFLVRVLGLLCPVRARLLLKRAWRGRRALALGGVGGLLLGGVLWLAVSGLYYLRVREDIRGGQGHMAVGARDLAFVGEGWSAPASLGNETVRFSRGGRSSVFLPLEGARGYALTMRMDPLAQAASITIFLNETYLARLEIRKERERIGAYALRLPAPRVREGRNRLDLVPSPSRPGLLLWSVQVARD